MQTIKIQPVERGLQGSIPIPGDKSISHRSIMLGALAEGKTVITNFLNSEDCLCTAKAFQNMGIEIAGLGTDIVVVSGNGLHGLKEPSGILDMGNSGTSTRLMSGILSGQSFYSVMSGDQSLCRRPMSRIIKPLTGMGGRLYARGNNQYLPMTIVGSPLKGIDYQSPVASAQVKSCLMLAGLYADGVTRITEPALSRDHTERMLTYLGVSFHRDGLTLSIQGTQTLQGKPIRVPGDISSAAFFMAAGVIVKGSEIILENVGLNPTRTGILDAIRSMGGQFEIINEIGKDWEPSGNIRIQFSQLKAAEFGGTLIPRIIDEVPILAVLATQAEGITVIKDAQELKVKETNRIDAVVNELSKMGAQIEGRDDGLVIEGPTLLKGARVQSYGDHRMAMSLAIAGLIAKGETLIEDTECIHTSFPNFMDLLQGLKG